LAKRDFVFTSESVSEGHPDKVCDRISDAIVDTFLAAEPQARCGVETMATTNRVVLAGEVRGPASITSEVIVEVGKLVGDQLTALDRERLETGDIRWHKRVQFTRLRLVERGLVKKDSPRGVWEITDDGRRALTAGTTKV